MTCKDKQLLSKHPIWNHCYNKYKSVYSDYEVVLYNDQDIYDIVKRHYPQYFDKIRQIKIGNILSHIFRYLILYLEGGIYSDFDYEPLKRIDHMFNVDYYHGGNDKYFYIYPSNKKITNNNCDFYNNPCNNNRFISSDNVQKYECLGHNVNNYSSLLCYEQGNDSNIFNGFMLTNPKKEIFLKMFNHYIKNIDSLISLSTSKRSYFDKVIKPGYSKVFRDFVMGSINNNTIIFNSERFYCVQVHSNESYVKKLIYNP